MHASIRKYKIDTDSVVALAVRVEDGFVPIISKLPGFVSYMIIDAGDGVMPRSAFLKARKPPNNRTPPRRSG
jgi:hypothetical protein